MARNPLLVAHQQARATDRELGVLFGRYIGTQAHNPRGRVLTAYGTARRAMLEVLGSERASRQWEALGVVRALRQQLADVGAVAVPLAEELGRASARAQVEAYIEAGGENYPAARDPIERGTVLQGWNTAVESRLAPIETLIATEADPGLIVSEEGGRLGALQPAPFQTDAAYWLAFVAAAAFAAWVWGRGGRQAERVPFRRQAVPAVDDRTTPCCLDVARRGQVVRFNEMFDTPEPPAYDRRQMWTPFHEWCRTSVVLYLEEYDEGITERLQDAARGELARR